MGKYACKVLIFKNSDTILTPSRMYIIIHGTNTKNIIQRDITKKSIDFLKILKIAPKKAG